MSTEQLLPYQTEILQTLHDPLTSELLVLARGLGLRKIISTLLKIYDSPQNLVLLVNTLPEEDASIGEELGILGCRKPGLRIVGYEMGRKERCEIASCLLLKRDSERLKDRISTSKAGSFL